MKRRPDILYGPKQRFLKMCLGLVGAGVLGLACLNQTVPETLIASSNLCSGVCNPIQVLVQERETAQRIPGVQILGLRWEGDTWRKVLECENGQVSTGTEENLVDEQGCFLMNVAGLYQFTAVAAGYDNLEQRLRLGSVETVDEFLIAHVARRAL